MRSKLLPPDVDDRLPALMSEAYERLEHDESDVEVAEWLAANSGCAVQPARVARRLRSLRRR
jgi:hypothetical protein